ncbi:XkdQ/YqbQ family protein [Clostridium paraputrificum]|uniref:XkdQ/YqbQ family protein n=1 Tax=Clostridium paraputrificum TaxID=29363 RepID=UPI003D34D833
MNIEMVVQNTNDGKAYDVSDIVSNIKYDSEIQDNPGKLTFTINNVEGVNYVSEGSPVSFKVNDNKVFWGYIFKIGKSKSHEVSITAYDQLRYLKNKDTYVTSGLTCEGIFKKICSDYSITSKVVHGSYYILPSRVNDNKTLAEIIQYAFDKTLIDTGDWFMMRDNFGTLEHINVWENRTNLVLGDESLLSDYSYESSIDDETYNQVKLVKENKKTKKREIYIVKDSSTINKWGILQYFERVDEEMNAAQIGERANMLLKHYNKPTKSLKLDCVGDLRVTPGCGVVLLIKDLESEVPYNKYVIVDKVSHSFENSSHTMNLEVKVV